MTADAQLITAAKAMKLRTFEVSNDCLYLVKSAEQTQGQVTISKAARLADPGDPTRRWNRHDSGCLLQAFTCSHKRLDSLNVFICPSITFKSTYVLARSITYVVPGVEADTRRGTAWPKRLNSYVKTSDVGTRVDVSTHSCECELLDSVSGRSICYLEICTRSHGLICHIIPGERSHHQERDRWTLYGKGTLFAHVHSEISLMFCSRSHERYFHTYILVSVPIFVPDTGRGPANLSPSLRACNAGWDKAQK